MNGEIVMLNGSGRYVRRPVKSVTVQAQDGTCHRLPFAERLIVEEDKESLLVIQRRFQTRDWLQTVAMLFAAFVLGAAAHATWLKRLFLL